MTQLGQYLCRLHVSRLAPKVDLQVSPSARPLCPHCYTPCLRKNVVTYLMSLVRPGPLGRLSLHLAAEALRFVRARTVPQRTFRADLFKPRELARIDA